MDKQLIRLYKNCDAAVRIFNFMERVSDDLSKRYPPMLAAEIEAADVFTYQDMMKILVQSLTSKDAYHLVQFVAVLLERYPKLLYELGDNNDDDEVKGNQLRRLVAATVPTGTWTRNDDTMDSHRRGDCGTDTALRPPQLLTQNEGNAL